MSDAIGTGRRCFLAVCLHFCHLQGRLSSGPQTTDPIKCHHPLITQLNFGYNMPPLNLNRVNVSGRIWGVDCSPCPKSSDGPVQFILCASRILNGLEAFQFKSLWCIKSLPTFFTKFWLEILIILLSLLIERLNQATFLFLNQKRLVRSVDFFILAKLRGHFYTT